MNSLRAEILSCAALVGVASARPASAVPPIEAPPADLATVSNYMKAVANNDHPAYARLFAPEARIVSDWPAAADLDVWLAALAPQFAPTRTTRFVAVYSRAGARDGKSVTRAVLVQEAKDCRPNVTECWGQFRTETLTLQNGLIVALERSNYTHGLRQPGGWTAFPP